MFRVSIKYASAARWLSRSASHLASQSASSVGVFWRADLFSQDEAVRGMGVSCRITFAARVEPLVCEFANGLEHAKAALGPCVIDRVDKALVEQRRHAIEHGDAEIATGVADGFGALQRAAAGEHRQPSEESLLRRRQERVTPLECVPQRLLSGRQIATRRRSAGRAATSVERTAARASGP